MASCDSSDPRTTLTNIASEMGFRGDVSVSDIWQRGEAMISEGDMTPDMASRLHAAAANRPPTLTSVHVIN